MQKGKIGHDISETAHSSARFFSKKVRWVNVYRCSCRLALVKFTLLTRDRAAYLVDRYSERKESAEELSRRVNLKPATG